MKNGTSRRSSAGYAAPAWPMSALSLFRWARRRESEERRTPSEGEQGRLAVGETREGHLWRRDTHTNYYTETTMSAWKKAGISYVPE